MRALRVLDTRREEIVDWLVHEAGAVREPAEFEWGPVRSGVVEVTSYPTRVRGRILPGVTPGKENRVHREPLGAVTVISPWNFPFQLSHRSVAPAVALGNTVVLKPAENTPVTGGLLLARIHEEAGLPPGALNVVVGRGGEIGDAPATHELSRIGLGRFGGEWAMEEFTADHWVSLQHTRRRTPFGPERPVGWSVPCRKMSAAVRPPGLISP
ncbi:aldehyde dehydrogenase family protein [Nocardiopsis sp. RV163]|uniref:aldehyde dehydrogenase family protein n=1 Tax=Nocardiopsis sp. RV163 TaxID=1661388 RepID=UPI000A84AE03|nr:aldehyde dehydrogenase family protein [Nocardiopsis sp. RV163]